MKRNRDFLKNLNNSWKKQPALWAIGLILITAVVNRLIDCAIPNRKDEVFIEMAKRLTGQADVETVARIKKQAIAYLTERLRVEYVTRTEMLNANMTIADLIKTNVSMLEKKIDAIAQLQDPDDRYRLLLRKVELDSDGGHIPVLSNQAWDFMTRLYEILKDDKAFRVPHVAEAFLQLALRQGYQEDERRRADLKEMVLFAMDYYEKCTNKESRDWSVYKAITLLLYDAERFNAFVMEQDENNPSFERQMRDSRFLNEAFFESKLWPLKRK